MGQPASDTHGLAGEESEYGKKAQEKAEALINIASELSPLYALSCPGFKGPARRPHMISD